MDIERTKEIYREIKTSVYNLNEHIKESEKEEERIIETNERPPAGLRTDRPSSSHNYWISGLRTQMWYRANNY
jgi:hypothetical protein|tara:strand:+ start:169 stop:387 length:219 start_codon:yes stop_codon:yes gene_type:complete